MGSVKAPLFIMKRLKTWPEIYSNRVGSQRYFRHFARKYGKFTSFIQKDINIVSPQMGKIDGINIVEIGCGIGSVSKQLLSYKQYQNMRFVFLDRSNDMLDLCRINIRDAAEVARKTTMKGHKLETIFHKFDLLTTNIGRNFLDSKYFTIIITHGVLEHFEDSSITKFFNNVMGTNNLLSAYHYVPTEKYKSPSRGDERLLSVNKWADLFSIAHFGTICNEDRYVDLRRFNLKTFNDGYDLIIKQ